MPAPEIELQLLARFTRSLAAPWQNAATPKRELVTAQTGAEGQLATRSLTPDGGPAARSITLGTPTVGPLRLVHRHIIASSTARGRGERSAHRHAPHHWQRCRSCGSRQRRQYCRASMETCCKRAGARPIMHGEVNCRRLQPDSLVQNATQRLDTLDSSTVVQTPRPARDASTGLATKGSYSWWASCTDFVSTPEFTPILIKQRDGAVAKGQVGLQRILQALRPSRGLRTVLVRISGCSGSSLGKRRQKTGHAPMMEFGTTLVVIDLVRSTVRLAVRQRSQSTCKSLATPVS